jgi:hypothetical protein
MISKVHAKELRDPGEINGFNEIETVLHYMVSHGNKSHSEKLRHAKWEFGGKVKKKQNV